jgi:hypothetical protein
MRLHHIIIALVVLSLFAVTLGSVSKDLFSGDEPGTGTVGGLGIPYANYTQDETSKNATNLINELAIITMEDSDSSVQDLAHSSACASPGGTCSNMPSGDSEDTEGLLQKSGLGVVTKMGKFLFSVPRLVINAIGGFLPIDKIFVTAAVSIFLILIAIILISSILRNRI